MKNFRLAYWYFLNGVGDVFIDAIGALAEKAVPRLRRRRRALDMLGHIKHYLWKRAWENEGDSAAMEIIQEALMAVYCGD